jgi:hypothetical protein
MNQPLLKDVSSTFKVDATLVERLGLTSWLLEVPHISWSDMKVVTKFGEAQNFETWFQDLLYMLNVIASTLTVSKHIRKFARHLRDYHNLQKYALEGYWEQSQRESPKSCDSDDSQVSTPPGTDSLIINRKRKDHENYDTPESIRRHLLELKADLKLKEIELGMTFFKKMFVRET